MKPTLSRTLALVGAPIIAASLLLAARLVWEQTVWSWERGAQMVGFSLMHSPLGLLLVLVLYAGVIWAVIVLVVAAVTRGFGGKPLVALLALYGLSWAAIAMPYQFWQRLFIDRFSLEHATEFMTHAAGRGDLATVQAFMARGLNVNAQGRYGSALHAAAAAGNLEVIEYLVEQGADVNALAPDGDSPMADAVDARQNAEQAQALLAKHGGALVRGSVDQRERATTEPLR